MAMRFFSGGLLFSSIISLVAAAAVSQNQTCRCFPGDTCWPSAKTWQKLNTTVEGRLIATVPIASPCHDDKFSSYNATQCNATQTLWETPEIHYSSSSSIMAPFFANQSCDPFTPPTAQCVVGTYVSYAVNVSKPEHVSAAIKFATKHNIRFIVRNTGHDYNGKSTGAGSLAVWMHNMKSTSFVNYSSQNYTGKAMKMGAGVQVFEGYAAADAQGLSIVGGECPTVGLAGGYVQGGGHSSLTSTYGLAADQVLEFEVVDGTGKSLTATPTKNTDLYWALAGGGGGTYGVVTSMTYKAYPNVPVSGANLTFASTGLSQDTFYDLVSIWHETMPTLADAGAAAVWFITNTSFAIAPLTAPNMNVTRLQSLMSPLTDALKQRNVTYTSTFRQFPTFLSQYNEMEIEIPVGVGQYGGRWIPRSVIDSSNANLTAAFRTINNAGGTLTIVGLNATTKNAHVFNSAHPAWRSTALDVVISTPYNNTAPLSAMLANQVLMTDTLLPALEALTPGGGAYMNEGDFRQKDWQRVFYGVNYERLVRIKNRYDPHHLFYAVTAVGSEYWAEDGEKRLCRTGA